MEKGTIVKLKSLSKIEKFVCEITWGNIPQDINWIRNSKLFIGKMKEFEQGKYKELFEQEKSKTQ